MRSFDNIEELIDYLGLEDKDLFVTKNTFFGFYNGYLTLPHKYKENMTYGILTYINTDSSDYLEKLKIDEFLKYKEKIIINNEYKVGYRYITRKNPYEIRFLRISDVKSDYCSQEVGMKSNILIYDEWYKIFEDVKLDETKSIVKFALTGGW